MARRTESRALEIEMSFEEPHAGDCVLLFVDNCETQTPDVRGDAFFARTGERGVLEFPRYGELSGEVEVLHAFRLGDQRFLLALGDATAPAKFAPIAVRSLLTVYPDAFDQAVLAGYHLHCWYRDNRFCGRCGTPLAPATDERALTCPACDNVTYPRISPAVIVAVTDADRVLMTRYARGPYRQRALVAGFVEVGETAEQAVAREVREECGLSVKNVRYYGSQPWGLSGALMLGYFAELDGSPDPALIDGELSWAGWVDRSDIAPSDDYALGRQMIEAFRDGRR